MVDTVDEVVDMAVTGIESSSVASSRFLLPIYNPLYEYHCASHHLLTEHQQHQQHQQLTDIQSQMSNGEKFAPSFNLFAFISTYNSSTMNLQHLTEYIANQTSTLSPITLPPLSLILPLAPISPIARLIQHVTTTPVHSTYYPYLRFGAIHAARVSIIWAGMTKGRKEKVGLVRDMIGYLTLACEFVFASHEQHTVLMIWSGGGGTITSLLLSQPPSWLITPTPWIIYPPIYLLLGPTGLSDYIASTTPTPVNIFGSYIDGMTRGTTIGSLPSLISTAGLSSNAWTTAILGGIATCGGGWIASGLGMNADEWKLGMPSVLNGGLLDTLDLWAGMLVAILYAALSRSHEELEPISSYLAGVLPDDLVLLTAKTGGAVVSTDIARAICVLVLGSLLCARVVTRLILTNTSSIKTGRFKVKAKGHKEKKEKTLEEMLEDEDKSNRAQAIKAPTKAITGGSKGAAKKNKKNK